MDKPFAPDLATARRLFQKADEHGTPLMSCSALRFVPSLQEALEGPLRNLRTLYAQTLGGGSSFWEYAIHQIEMLVMLLGPGARRVMQCGNRTTNHMIIDYGDDRSACMTLSPSTPFSWRAHTEDGQVFTCSEVGDFFQGFVDAMLEFLVTGKSRVDRSETLEIAALTETGIRALQTPHAWVDVAS
jgi:predicted dehydrogenase